MFFLFFLFFLKPLLFIYSRFHLRWVVCDPTTKIAEFNLANGYVESSEAGKKLNEVNNYSAFKN